VHLPHGRFQLVGGWPAAEQCAVTLLNGGQQIFHLHPLFGCEPVGGSLGHPDLCLTGSTENDSATPSCAGTACASFLPLIIIERIPAAGPKLGPN